MARFAKVSKLVALSVMGSLMSGACVPDNFWADVWGYTVIDTTVAAVVNNALTAAGL